MHLLSSAISWLNIPANMLAPFFLFPVPLLPGWLSNTLISAITGLLLLIIFKFTSNQKAIGSVRDIIKADMLAIKLYKDNPWNILSSQFKIFGNAAKLLIHSFKPLIIMTIPVLLLLSQMGLWYQTRPLVNGEETIVSLKLNDMPYASWPKIKMDPPSGADIINGPVRIFSKNEILWKIRAKENGNHLLRFLIDQSTISKEFTVGDDLMRVSVKRPGWNWTDILTNPAEPPFQPSSPVQSITVEYPDRISKISGTDWWVIYFFICSMVFALIFKPVFKVRI